MLAFQNQWTHGITLFACCMVHIIPPMYSRISSNSIYRHLSHFDIINFICKKSISTIWAAFINIARHTYIEKGSFQLGWAYEKENRMTCTLSLQAKATN